MAKQKRRSYGLTEPLSQMADLPIVANRAPLTSDVGYGIGTIWIDSSASNAYILTLVAAGSATWNLIAVNLGDLETLTGDTGGAIGPDGSHNIDIVGSGGISVDGNPATNTLTISSSGKGMTWTTVTGGTQACAIDNGYIVGNVGGVSFTLPAVAPIGSVIEIFGAPGFSGGWAVSASGAQQIYFSQSLIDATPPSNLTSRNETDSVALTCVIANTTWIANSTNVLSIQ